MKSQFLKRLLHLKQIHEIIFSIKKIIVGWFHSIVESFFFDTLTRILNFLLNEKSLNLFKKFYKYEND